MKYRNVHILIISYRIIKFLFKKEFLFRFQVAMIYLLIIIKIYLEC
jgi:hypothetical protein